MDLYNQLQKEADALATEGYTARGKKARLDLKNTFNTLISEKELYQERINKYQNNHSCLNSFVISSKIYS